jgi:hypothetical protein
MDSNAPPHRVRIVQQYLEQLNVEHLWDILQMAIRQQPRSLRVLENILMVTWNAVTQSYPEADQEHEAAMSGCDHCYRGFHTRYLASHYSPLSPELAFEKMIRPKLKHCLFPLSDYG